MRAIDRRQQHSRVLGFIFAVIKKSGDDRSSALAILLTYNGFLAIFPLLLVMTTVLGFFLGHYPRIEHALIHSAVARFPIVGDQLSSNVHPLHGSTFGLIVGLAGSVWGSLGVAQAGQLAMAEVWNIRGVVRPNFVTRLVRSFVLLGVVAVGVVATAVLSALAARGGTAVVVRLAAAVGAAGFNVALYVATFRVLTQKSVATRKLLPGAIGAGLAWTVLLSLGGYLVGHQVRHASQIYGLFAYVLGLLSWLYLTAEITLYGAEVNVVLAERLWPRSIVQPPLTEADQRALELIAGREERRPEESVSVSFQTPPGSTT